MRHGHVHHARRRVLVGQLAQGPRVLGRPGLPGFGGIFAIMLSCVSSRRGLHGWQPVEGFELRGDLPEEVTA